MKKTITSGEDTRYWLGVVRVDGKVVPQFCGKPVNWLTAHNRMERFKDMKKYWIGKREFPIKSLKLVEITTKWKRIVESEDETTRNEEEIEL